MVVWTFKRDVGVNKRMQIFFSKENLLEAVHFQN